MHRLILAFGIVLLALLASREVGFAARPLASEPLPPGDVLELVVFEVDGCTYCRLFRRDVLPAYVLSPRAGEVPIRFVDLNDGMGGIRLDAPVEIVPTAILVKNNREAGRISGYAGPESFFQLMRYLLSRAE
jgi:thioredoxin-related protein